MRSRSSDATNWILVKYSILILFLILAACNFESDSVLSAQSDYFDGIQSNDVGLGLPREGEWRYEHHEGGQTFEQYRNRKPPKFTDSADVIYLKPLGQFSDLQLKVLEQTREYVEIFFQKKTLLQEPVSGKLIPEWAWRWNQEGFEQAYAPYILDTILKGKIPANGIALMAFSEKDLYPSGDWNFVFGIASYKDRVGVSSIFRLEDQHLDSSNIQKTLSRLIKITSHEIGHMFSLMHCTYAECVMNGSNHLGETDATPVRACSECQKKLLWCLRYNNDKRAAALSAFFREKGFEEELKLSDMDLKHVD